MATESPNIRWAALRTGNYSYTSLVCVFNFINILFFLLLLLPRVAAFYFLIAARIRISPSSCATFLAFEVQMRRRTVWSAVMFFGGIARDLRSPVESADQLIFRYIFRDVRARLVYVGGREQRTADTSFCFGWVCVCLLMIVLIYS